MSIEARPRVREWMRVDEVTIRKFLHTS